MASQITEAKINLTVISVGKKKKLDLFLNLYIINCTWIRKPNVQTGTRREGHGDRRRKKGKGLVKKQV